MANRKSKQKAYRAKRYATGRCQRCPKKRMKGKVLCKACTLSRRIWQRSYVQAKPWHEGSRGRPPIHGPDPFIGCA